jgi:hypothetical protein
MGPVKKGPPPKKYIVYCDSCGKQKVDIGYNLQQMTQVPLAKVPGGVPKLSPEGKAENRPTLPRPKMVKCPMCGRGLAVRGFAVPESNHTEVKEENENIIKNNIIDRREVRSTGSAIQKYLARGATDGRAEVPEQSGVCVQSPDIPQGFASSESPIASLLSGQRGGVRSGNQQE